MSFTSFSFFVLIAVCCAGYYLVKRSRRWICLLLFSALYYAAAGPALLIFILFAAFTTWVGAGYAARQKRAAVAIPLLLDFGVLAYLKYSPFVVSLLNLLPGRIFPSSGLRLSRSGSPFTPSSRPATCSTSTGGAARRS